MATATTGLHDDRCATRKGHRCNCPSAVFETPSQHPAHALTWNLVARLSASGDGFTASVSLADPDDGGRPVWGIVQTGAVQSTKTGRGRSEMEALLLVDEELRKQALVIKKPWAPSVHFSAFVFDESKVWIGTLSVWADGTWMVHRRGCHSVGRAWMDGKSESAFLAREAAYEAMTQLQAQAGKEVA